MSQLFPREKQKSEKKQNKTKQPKRILRYKYRRDSLPVTVPMTSTWENRLCTSTLWVAWSAQPLLAGSADVLAGIPVQQITQDYRVHRAVRVPQGLEGLFPLPQKAWCGGCPAGVYCAGLTHACIAPSLLYLYHKIRFGCFVLFCFVLFCFVLFCFVLFCFVLFCFVLFCFVLFCFFFTFLFFPGTQLGHYTCKSPLITST